VNRPTCRQPELAELVEDVHVEYFAHLAAVPGLEVHCDADVTWKLSPASAWSNCAVRVRLSPRDAGQRLEEILARYRANGRGAGFWVGPSAGPEDLEALLKAKRLRCRKYFPAMYCDLRRTLPEVPLRLPIEFSTVTDYDLFRREPHPGIGPITTPFRRFALESRRFLADCRPRRSWDLLATLDGKPAGIATVFVGRSHAGVFDVAVPESLRNQGIGRALVGYACAFAQQHGALGAILIATNAGYRVYCHAGFREVARIGFWYTARP
jgi:GNAT superfamily N-acetyltransferase